MRAVFRIGGQESEAGSGLNMQPAKSQTVLPYLAFQCYGRGERILMSGFHVPNDVPGFMARVAWVAHLDRPTKSWSRVVTIPPFASRRH